MKKSLLIFSTFVLFACGPGNDIELVAIGSDTKKPVALERATKLKANNIQIDGQEIEDILTVNGIRFSFKDGSWGLIRASSNKPSLVVVTESPTSDERKKRIFDFIDQLLQKTNKIGEYDQKI